MPTRVAGGSNWWALCLVFPTKSTCIKFIYWYSLGIADCIYKPIQSPWGLTVKVFGIRAQLRPYGPPLSLIKPLMGVPLRVVCDRMAGTSASVAPSVGSLLPCLMTPPP